MNEQRASRPTTNGSEPWLDWLWRPLRQLWSGRAPEGHSLAPLAAAPRAGGRAPVVQHTRAGDVYRL